MRLLIVEDDLAQQRLLQHLAARWEYPALVASTGGEALSILGRREVSIAVVDWDLPDMTGLDICRHIRESGVFVHAIVLSARDEDADVPAVLEAGASDYLGKPFAQSELRARLLVGSRMVRLHQQISQMQKLESIGQLAAGVAHEINTPSQFVSDNLRFACESVADLSELIGVHLEAIDHLRQQGTAVELVEKLDMLHQEKELEYLLEELPVSLQQSLDGITRIARIVRAMKSFSHPGTVERTMVDLIDAIQSTATVARFEWRQVARVEIELDESLPQISAHASELNQVFLNLLVNAAHAVETRHGQDPETGRISIRGWQELDRVRLDFADNGCGVPPQFRARIFDPFFTTKEVGKGTGQGLAIAYDVIVRNHGGRIWIEDQAEGGARFCLELPISNA